MYDNRHGAVWSLAVSPNGQIVSGHQDGGVCFQKLMEGNIHVNLQTHLLYQHDDAKDGLVCSVAISEDGTRVVSGSKHYIK